jgi:dihydrofolate synthase/folylpolyglutamate synthase
LVHAVVLTRIPSDRGGDPAPLLSVAPGAEVIEDPWDAVRSALETAAPGHAVLTTGSLALLSYLMQRRSEILPG